MMKKIQQNLFNTWYNSLLTLISLWLIYWISSSLISWGFTQAEWGVLQANLRLFFLGRYPVDLLWRPWTILGIIMGLGTLSWRSWLLTGGLFLETVKLDDLGGLVLTLLTALVSIVLSFPFGVLLALGRQSNLPVIRWLSIGYIELIRGLPLIGILFMAQVMVPLVLPPDIRPDRVVRAICGLTMFSAAYLAENVRGGLQSIPKGQTEAAKALGLSTPLVLALIILPQALKAVIPTIVGQFISLFKDTSLLAIVGLVELLGISQSILANPKFLGRYGEVYLFIALIYWIFCYSMSLASQKFEQKL
ncbi:MAG: amino acid ABC transporter permease [Prochloron sp. SP5CPC1]|nr:amino acid ABC transporter permease [Candidatus Paraprochloron terpiosi SP5CPC1]